MKTTPSFFCNTKALFVLFALILLFSCSKDEIKKIDAITNRAVMPCLHATEITTLISDSGITRYRIATTQWDVFDKANPPYQEFPKGIHLERFDEKLHVDGNIKSDYARFDDNEKVWELRGNVKSTNIQGEVFETEQLFWNQREKRIYSDKFIKITQVSRVITGIGFESNESMTKYTISKPQAIIPIKETDK